MSRDAEPTSVDGAPETKPGTSPAPSAAASASLDIHALNRAATAALYGAIGVAVAVLAVFALSETRLSAEARTLLILITILVTGVALLRVIQGAFAVLLRLQGIQFESVGRIEQKIQGVSSGLEHLAAALEAARAGAPAASDRKLTRLAEVRHAIRSGAWDDAAGLVVAFTEAHPDDPDAPRLSGELARARQAAAEETLAKVGAARAASDPERVIELRGALKPLLAPDALHALDRDLARWFMTLIQRRLRGGTVRADVAVLAGRVAESLDETPEGASLRASLPTLRRAAGLCPRCGQPYTGIENACPACQAGPSLVTTPPPSIPPTPTEGPPPD